ncbi:hypothetical protein lerEdw1_002343 [Lerista edwardsae]|nr:hypothetical protein lerEdw1_002343 [Lerista edwardsae]
MSVTGGRLERKRKRLGWLEATWRRWRRVSGTRHLCLFPLRCDASPCLTLVLLCLPERGNLAGVQHIVLVLSGKGGVGKSTISTELALALRQAGKKVGILDVDLCGPSIPHMLNVRDQDVHQCDSGWVPVFVDQDKSISLMSIGFLLEKPDDAVIWRGPKKNALIKQFVSDVAWGELDFLIVDTPPGTSDEHISTVESLRPYKPLGAILVTTPQVFCQSVFASVQGCAVLLLQAVAVGDVRRELTFCKKTGLPVLGIVENMSGFVCPHCSCSSLNMMSRLASVATVMFSLLFQECTNIFSKGGGQELAKHAGVPFLGCVPLDPQLSQSLEEGGDFIQEFPKSLAFPALASIAQHVLAGASVCSS